MTSRWLFAFVALRQLNTTEFDDQTGGASSAAVAPFADFCQLVDDGDGMKEHVTLLSEHMKPMCGYRPGVGLRGRRSLVSIDEK